MSSLSGGRRCERTELVAAYVLAALDEAEARSMEAHMDTCAECQQEYDAIRPVTHVLTDWRAQNLPPADDLWNRVTERIAAVTQKPTTSPIGTWSDSCGWPEPRWEDVAPGIACKLLSTDRDMDRVSMLVELAPGASYPPHRHAAVEELYLLRGELWIDEKKLCPGDYNRADAGSSDQRVWSERGCMCLLITSPSDQLR